MLCRITHATSLNFMKQRKEKKYSGEAAIFFYLFLFGYLFLFSTYLTGGCRHHCLAFIIFFIKNRINNNNKRQYNRTTFTTSNQESSERMNFKGKKTYEINVSSSSTQGE